MTPIPYNHSIHWQQVKGWIDARQGTKSQGQLQESMLSPLGLIIEGHCASWLMRVNGTSIAIIEPTTANPALDQQTRSAALDILIPDMLRLAQEHGVTRLIGMSYLPAIIDRALALGFTILPDTLFHKDL